MQDDDDADADADDDSDDDCRRERNAGEDDIRCSAAALDLAVPADGTLRPLESLDGRWTCMSMPQHVNLIAYGGQFTDATWPSFGRRLRLRRSAAAAPEERPRAAECVDVLPAAQTEESALAQAVTAAVQAAAAAAATPSERGGGCGGCGGRQCLWRRFFSYLRGLFRSPSSLAKRRVRRASPCFQCTTL